MGTVKFILEQEPDEKSLAETCLLSEHSLYCFPAANKKDVFGVSGLLSNLVS